MAEGSVTDDTGLREACGVFGCVSAKEWPTQLDVPHIICLGLVGLQHRYILQPRMKIVEFATEWIQI